MDFGFYSRLGKLIRRIFVTLGAARTINSQSVTVFSEKPSTTANQTLVEDSAGAFSVTDGGAGFAVGAKHVRTNGNPVNLFSINVGTAVAALFRNVRIASVTTLSGAGAVPITHETVLWTTTGANAGTLANGSFAGQRVTVIMVVDGGNGTVTPATPLGTATAVLGDVGDAVTWEWTGAAWAVVANQGAALS